MHGRIRTCMTDVSGVTDVTGGRDTAVRVVYVSGVTGVTGGRGV